MTVTQAPEEGVDRGQEGPLAETPIAFDAAVSEFLAYLKGYRHYSPWTVRAYGIDLREFRKFLLEQTGRMPEPHEISRPQVVAWGLQLRGMKPLTIATLRSSEAPSLRSTSRPQVYPPPAGTPACRPFRQRRTSFSFLQDPSGEGVASPTGRQSLGMTEPHGLLPQQPRPPPASAQGVEKSAHRAVN